MHAAAADGGEGGAAIRGGQHYDEFRELRSVPEYANDEATAKRLWELSEKMAGIEFSL